jgi:hypothetical protein
MASPAFEPGRPGVDAVELARLIERGLKQSGALDTEALCVLPGRKVRGSHWMCDQPGQAGGSLQGRDSRQRKGRYKGMGHELAVLSAVATGSVRVHIGCHVRAAVR